MNKWQEFAKLHNMSHEDFAKELIECAQAVLAIDLVKVKSDKLEIIAAQNDGIYKLTFERIVK